MNREGSISNFCPYEVTEGIQLLKLGMFGNTEYNLVMFLNIKSFSATFCVKKEIHQVIREKQEKKREKGKRRERDIFLRVTLCLVF